MIKGVDVTKVDLFPMDSSLNNQGFIRPIFDITCDTSTLESKRIAMYQSVGGLESQKIAKRLQVSATIFAIFV